MAISPIETLITRSVLGDRVWEDVNGNGLQDCADTNGNGILGDAGDTGPECGAGLPGVPVSLYPFANGVCQSGGAPVGSTVTDEGGFYAFPGLEPGGYCVAFTPPADLCGPGVAPLFTAPNAGDDAADSDADPATGQTGGIALAAGDIDLSVDAGLYCGAALGDYLWDDLNRDGIQNDGETGINGQNVFLLDCDGAMVDNTLTANDASGNPGFYLFDGLAPGCYVVEFTKPADFVFTQKNAPGAACGR